jgi:hypothetical protein
VTVAVRCQRLVDAGVRAPWFPRVCAGMRACRRSVSGPQGWALGLLSRTPTQQVLTVRGLEGVL